MLLPQGVATFLLSLVAGRLALRFGPRDLLVVGTVVSVAGYLGLALVHEQRWQIYVVSTVMGAGFGLAFSALANLIVAAVPPDRTGVASGMNADIRTIGGAVGAAAVASIVTAGAPAGGLPDESGYTAGFLVLAGALALSALAALLIPAVRRDRRTDEEPAVPLRHPQSALVAGGTLVGDDPE